MVSTAYPTMHHLPLHSDMSCIPHGLLVPSHRNGWELEGRGVAVAIY